MKTPKKSLLDVSLDHLEEDARENPQLAYVWGMEHAKAKKAVKEAEQRLKLVVAQIGNSVRARNRDLTVQAVKDAIESSKEYKEAWAALTEAEYDADRIGVMVHSIELRKRAITDMVTLFGQMYWSKPDTSGKPKNADSARKRTMERAGRSVRDVD